MILNKQFNYIQYIQLTQGLINIQEYNIGNIDNIWNMIDRWYFFSIAYNQCTANILLSLMFHILASFYGKINHTYINVYKWEKEYCTKQYQNIYNTSMITLNYLKPGECMCHVCTHEEANETLCMKNVQGYITMQQYQTDTIISCWCLMFVIELYSYLFLIE